MDFAPFLNELLRFRAPMWIIRAIFVFRGQSRGAARGMRFCTAWIGFWNGMMKTQKLALLLRFHLAPLFCGVPAGLRQAIG